MRTQLTVTLPPRLGQYVEEVSAELGMKKSAVIEHALEADRERRTEDLLREGYEEMAEHDLALHEEFEHVDGETPLPEYAEK
jgi:predicted transcriptional regulator